ncbi:MAG: ABC transporter permease [Anaerolineales bacterium]|nr:ABC transporter permease [Anaerolineales bacterium]
MYQYLAQRFLLAIPVVLCVTAVVFAILQLVPGDPVRIMAGNRASEERLDEIREQLGLDQPIATQYGRWLGQVLQGDMGVSIALKRPVAEVIVERFPFTLRLTFTALVVSLLLGIPLGVLAATKHNQWLDHLISYVSLFWFSMPGFWLGMMLIVIFGIRLRWTPISGHEGALALVLPTLTLSLPQMGALARLTRSAMLEVLGENYILVARAKGLPLRIVYFRHALRNALVPITTLLFLSLPLIFGGAVIIETIFGWPGIGRLMYDALLKKDFPIVQGLLLIFALSTVVANILGDVVAARLDPRSTHT